MRKNIIRFAVIIGIIVLGIFALYYFTSTRDVTFTLTHVNSATIKDSDNRTVKTISNSGEKARLFKDQSYAIEYDAADGYQDDSKVFTVDDKNITITPYYSSERLASLLTENKQAIRSVVTSEYSNISQLYDFENERLYHFGEWYSATLKYKGTDIFNADTLRLVVHKDGDTWRVASKPPMPILNAYNSGDTGDVGEVSSDHNHVTTSIPIDILSRVNSD